MTETPAERIFHGRASPADIASFDQARAEAADDLQRLRVAFAARTQESGPDAAHTAFVLGLLREWGPMSMASALVEAMRQELERWADG